MRYLKVDSADTVVGLGACPDELYDELVRPDGIRFIAFNQAFPDMAYEWKWQNETLVQQGLRIVLDYSAKRRADYPPIGEQLDALWHAMDTGTLPKVPEFFNPIDTVKRRHPQPT
jgi:hypothetical protein